MSENGPREGTRDLPRPAPDAGRRAIEADSLAGVAYGSLSRSLRRRRAELLALAEAGGTVSAIAKSYGADHPLEPEVTAAEVEAALTQANAGKRGMSGSIARIASEPRPRVRKPGARA